ncbi:MAG TPA: hypothetical protein VIG04_11695 [Gemmatimonadales bacterium]
MRQSKVWISIGILVVIGLHAVPVLSAGLRKQMWPFLDWGMYKDSRAPGPIQVKKKRIFAVTQTGQKERVTPDLLGSTGYGLHALYEVPLLRNDSAAAQDLFRRLNFQRQDPFVELRVESETYTVSDTGVVKQDNPVITYRPAPSPPR